MAIIWRCIYSTSSRVERDDVLGIHVYSSLMLLLLLAVFVCTSEAFVTRVVVHNRGVMFPLNVATSNNLLRKEVHTTIKVEDVKIKDTAVSSSQKEVSKDDMKRKEEIDLSMIQQVRATEDEDVKAVEKIDEEVIPSTWPHALHRFFLGEIGPPLVVLSISGFIYTRCQLPIPVSLSECTVFISMIVFWSLQEYILHRVVLHSKFNHIGKEIHQGHHEKNYFHISIDPPALLLGWLLVAHLIIKSIFPWHICLSATIGYALSGLFYEWSHYIVHTKVRPPRNKWVRSFFLRVRNNHMRHHLLDDDYWYAFSVAQESPR